MTEIELKFLLDVEGVQRLKGRLAGLHLDATTPRTHTLRTVYYDTPDHRLKATGTALRLRCEARRWTQTVKARTTINGGLMRTQEVDNAAPAGRLDLSRIADPDVRAEVETTVGDSELLQVCETQMKRLVCVLTLESGAQVELAIDEGEIIAGERKEPFREAELELKAGEVHALFDLAAVLFPEGGLRLSTMSKSERGYLLAATGKATEELCPRTARAVPLAEDITSEIAARDILRECFEQISANIDVLQHSTAPEGPHQLRIGLRRLRAAIGMFRPVIGHPELERMKREARWIGAQVGALRDLDVVMTFTIDPTEAQQSSEPGFEALRNAVSDRRDEVRKELRTLLRGRRVQSFQIDLARFIETRGWLSPEDLEQTGRLAMPIQKHSRRALNRRWKSVRKKARKIDRLTIDARHELRKELKKLRYAVEFLGPLYPDRKVRKFIRRTKRLQNVFGDLNDLAMAEELLCTPTSPGALDPAAQRAVGWILGTRTVQSDAAWSHARKLWRSVTRTGPFWG